MADGLILSLRLGCVPVIVVHSAKLAEEVLKIQEYKTSTFYGGKELNTDYRVEVASPPQIPSKSL